MSTNGFYSLRLSLKALIQFAMLINAVDMYNLIIACLVATAKPAQRLRVNICMYR